MVNKYVDKKNDDEHTTFKDLADMFVDLRILNSRDKFKRSERRTDHDHLQMLMDVEACPKISVQDLFEAERPDMPIPVRSLVIGKPGIGKSIFSVHVVDLWLRNQLLHNTIHQIFHFSIRGLSAMKTCSLEDLFFGGLSADEKPSHQAIVQFFKQMHAEPSRYAIILDGLDEAKVTQTENRAFRYDERVEMPRLIGSIINGHTLRNVRVLVTSRPGGVTNYKAYDRKAEIYGFTRGKMSDYIRKFSAANSRVQESIEHYIDGNVNICSFCYIPAHLILVCRIVKARMEQESNPELPETVTELFAAAVGNFLVKHHREHRESTAHKPVEVIAKFKRPVLQHAKLARYGMEEGDIKVTFSQDEIRQYHLEHETTKCGLLSESRESGVVLTTQQTTFSFDHLTLQEFLAAAALVTNIKRVQRMTTTASNRQLDLVLIFLAGLLGNHNNEQFLCSLHSRWWKSYQRSFRRNRAQFLEELMKSVITRERTNEESTGCDPAVHKESTLLLITMIFESRQPELWRHVDGYILNGGTELDLSYQHLSPTEQHALAYVLPQTGLTSLK